MDINNQKSKKNIMQKLKDKYLFDLVHLKKTFFGRFGNKYYSQSGEDKILSKIFSNKQKGFYIDIGAYHPIHYSNTYLLFKKGWRGINIDPNSKSINFFNKYRKEDINIQAGISEEKKEADYYIFNHQSCNTFSKNQKEEVEKKSYIKLLKKEMVICYPLKEILNKHSINTKIDLMNIDTEGVDLEVLKSNDWYKFRPSVIVIENPKFNLKSAESDPIYSYLKEKEYSLYGTTELSLIFTSNKE